MTETEPETLEDSLPAPSATPSLSQPHLFVVLECDRLEAGGARYSLSGVDEVIVGRGNQRSASREVLHGTRRLVVRVPGRSMSSTHARLSRSEQGWVLEDARSTNGTFVRGRRVQRAVLADGDVFELGHSLFVIRTALPTPPEADGEADFLQAKDDALFTLLPALAAEFSTLARIARSALPVLLLGETGTGKEIVASAVHRLSERSGPLVAINCAGLTPTLVESQLFGHVRGAFSGAVRDECGFVRSAHGGTLLLDELGDLPGPAQATLLRVLQEQRVTPVGASHGLPVDVRVVAATNRPIDIWTREGRFREDLLARLATYCVRLPSLDRRREDIGCIVARRLELTAERGHSQPAAGASWRLTTEGGLALLTASWKLNIRELVQALERAFVLAPDRLITLPALALDQRVLESTPPARTRSERPESPADAQVKRQLLQALEAHRGNVAHVAAAMGKKRMQIHRWMKRFGFEPSAFRHGAGSRTDD